MTMKKINYFLCCCVVLSTEGSISIVYNLRVAETSKKFYLEPTSKPSLGTVTLFGTFRKKYNGVTHHCGGGLFTLVYAPPSFFLRVDGAVGRVGSNTNGVHFSRTQTDDLLFSGGYSPKISDRTRLTFSGLLGFPTHKDTSLQFVQFGYGHYALGAQIDGSFAYTSNRNHLLRYAGRLIHFFPRKVVIPVNAQLERFNYGVGNLADLFIALHSKKEKHSMEAGYDASFFFNAQISPAFDDAVKKTNYIRNSFYGIYKYRFLMGKKNCMVGVALSYGFEPTPKVSGNKRLITTWGSLSINF